MFANGLKPPTRIAREYTWITIVGGWKGGARGRQICLGIYNHTRFSRFTHLNTVIFSRIVSHKVFG